MVDDYQTWLKIVGIWVYMSYLAVKSFILLFHELWNFKLYKRLKKRYWKKRLFFRSCKNY